MKRPLMNLHNEPALGGLTDEKATGPTGPPGWGFSAGIFVDDAGPEGTAMNWRTRILRSDQPVWMYPAGNPSLKGRTYYDCPADLPGAGSSNAHALTKSEVVRHCNRRITPDGAKISWVRNPRTGDLDLFLAQSPHVRAAAPQVDSPLDVVVLDGAVMGLWAAVEGTFVRTAPLTWTLEGQDSLVDMTSVDVSTGCGLLGLAPGPWRLRVKFIPGTYRIGQLTLDK